jgi:hypothetical protein
MGTHHGKSGVVMVGTDVVAEVTAFDLSDDTELVEDTVMGDSYKTYKEGHKSWSGSLSCFWDETDSTGQEALASGGTVTLKLYPEGSATGAKYYYGSVLIQKMSIAVPKDGIVTREFSFQGTGALTLGTAS